MIRRSSRPVARLGGANVSRIENHLSRVGVTPGKRTGARRAGVCPQSRRRMATESKRISAVRSGPIVADRSHPGVTNDEFRRTGAQVTMPLADLANPILQPWAREALKKRNDLVAAGKAPSLGIDCG